MNKKKIAKMFENLCCSDCKSDFDENSVNILRQEDNFFVINITCNKCHKSFGIAFLGINSVNMKDEDISDNDILEVQETIKPISYDDVLDAHEYIKNLDENWQNFVSKHF